MELVKDIILLLVGLTVFMVGMDMMSNGMKKVAGKGLRGLFKKIGNNRLAGYGIGMSVTAIIQSSSATSVMVIGFLNAGIMTLLQGICIMLGAYVGTSATGLIVSLSTLSGGSGSFKLSAFLIGFAFIGLVMTFFKKPLVKNLGTLLSGLGLLFFGLETMSGVFDGTSQVYLFFVDLFSNVSFPLLLVLIGAVFTAIVQSSSATSGIVIMLVAKDALTLTSGIYLVIGATVGACAITVIASLSGNVNAKRMSVSCMIARIVMALVATGIIWIIVSSTGGAEKCDNFILGLFNEQSGLALAVCNVAYNIIVTLIALPLAGVIAKLGEITIKDTSSLKKDRAVQYIDDNMLREPAIAKMQAKKEIMGMMDLAFTNLKRGYVRITTQDKSEDKVLVETEERIDNINEKLTPYLIKLTGVLDGEESKRVGSWFHVINDVERIGDHANNFYEMSLEMEENELKFSETAVAEFKRMFDVIEQMIEIVPEIFDEKDKSHLHQLHVLEDETDRLKKELSTAHYDRMKEGACKVILSPYYTSLLSNLERVADHLVNVGYSIIDPTGHDTEEQ
ncbi:MAG: Na/Pi cotransporter family protein [Bacilli bacterium]|nr:Na/Pi cotransporter family protein [Bacilli bacterium]